MALCPRHPPRRARVAQEPPACSWNLLFKKVAEPVEKVRPRRLREGIVILDEKKKRFCQSIESKLEAATTAVQMAGSGERPLAEDGSVLSRSRKGTGGTGRVGDTRVLRLCDRSDRDTT